MHVTLIEKAIDLALRAHAGQKRKYSDLPYIVHPAAVASYVTGWEDATEEAIAAAWLHDVLEDGEASYREELLDNFPWSVVKLVQELTNDTNPGLSRKERKKLDRERLASASPMAKRIKMVDRFHNLSTIGDGPPKFVKLYIQESYDLLEAVGDADESLASDVVRILNDMVGEMG